MSLGSRASSLQPSTSKVAGKKKINNPPSDTAGPMASSSSKVATPTAASSSRSVHAPSPRPPPFGSNTPRLPSHMTQQGSRAPRMEEIEDEEPLRRNEALPLAKGVPILELADPQSANVASAGQSPSGTPLATSSKPTLSEESEMEMIGSTDVGREEEMICSATHSSSSHRDFSPTLENESVTASLALRSARQAVYGDVAPERFFTRVGRSIELFKESIDAAVQRYHGAYDPYSSSQEDPLLPYGAIHGEIPDMDPASSLALRDAVMRYEYPSRNFEWSRLSDLVEGVVQLDAAKVTLMPTADPETEERYYSLNLASLSLVGHTVVAMQQILQALTIFLRRDPATSFYLDPGYGFLYMLEICSSQKELRFALTTLQMCLARANVHVRSYFRGIRETLTNEQFSEQISSVDSTISEVRRDFGGQHPRKELFRLLNRDDYGQRASLIDDAARRNKLAPPGNKGQKLSLALMQLRELSPPRRELDLPRPRLYPQAAAQIGAKILESPLWSLREWGAIGDARSFKCGIATAPQSTGNPIPAVGPALSTNAWTSYHFQTGPTTTTTTVPQQTVVAVPGGTGSSGPPGGVPPGWTGRIPARRNGGDVTEGMVTGQVETENREMDSAEAVEDLEVETEDQVDLSRLHQDLILRAPLTSGNQSEA
ncbi:hypothetical protein B0H13DRAFT_2364945 [Mycena leptocephala]|nr:hypothetical protein B0H13DRAFT_2364945 [Mycena leptocephala]